MKEIAEAVSSILMTFFIVAGIAAIPLGYYYFCDQEIKRAMDKGYCEKIVDSMYGGSPSKEKIWVKCEGDEVKYFSSETKAEKKEGGWGN